MLRTAVARDGGAGLDTGGASAVPIGTRVNRECVRLLARQALTTVVVALVVAAGLLYLLWPKVSHQNIYIWSAVFLSVSAFRYVSLALYFRFENRLSTFAWRRVLEAGAFLAGVSWGLSALWIFPATPLLQIFLLVLMMGLAAGASSSLSVFISAFILFLLPMMLPATVRVLLEPDPLMHVGAILSFTFNAAMISIAFNNQKMLREALTLRFKNADLVLDLEALARHDPLTGLANRLILTERLELALKRADRGEHDVAVMFIDCDKFKLINDAYGHNFGDEYLKLISQSLNSCVRSVDTVARLGGDEFIVLLEKCGERADVARVAERIFRELSGDIRIDDIPLHPEISVGISCYPGDGSDAATIIHQADEAMYKVKQSGGNTFSFYTM